MKVKWFCNNNYQFLIPEICNFRFLKEEPERLESALRRCKKLTGTLVTLKRYVNITRELQVFQILNSLEANSCIFVVT